MTRILDSKNKASIAVGLTTAPRLESTIEKTINSLAEAGWSNIHIFAEPNSPIPQSLIVGSVSRRKSLYGAWANYYWGLAELYDCETDLCVMFQDDIVVASGTYEYTGELGQLAKNSGCLSLFCPGMYRGPNEWNVVGHGQKLWMAQAIVYSRESAKSILESPYVWRVGGDRAIDNRIGLHFQETKKDVLYHTPSLVQHIGNTSTLWDGVPVAGDRMAVDFCPTLLVE